MELIHALYIPDWYLYLEIVLHKVSNMTDGEKEKIRSLQSSEIPIKQRRALYNQMGRRFQHPNGLKAGLLQKYNSCASDQKQRFNMLKEFIISEDM